MPGDTRRTDKRPRKPAASTSWDPLAHWYDGWVGEGGSEYHRQVAVPAVLRLFAPQPRGAYLGHWIGAGRAGSSRGRVRRALHRH